MGNKLGRRRQVVDDKYTRPQGLYQHKDVDHKKLRKLILESKLAPCYLGDDDCSNDLEECPICFLYYPSLNRSRCCMKSICTECFLQMKTPNSARPTQCPFCKTANYAVEYRGTKTKEEKGLEQLEEQRVIEAQIRMRQQELHDEEARTHERQGITSPSHAGMSTRDNGSNLVAEPSSSEEIVSTPPMSSVTNRQLVQTRDDEFDVDLEDIMVMEAIWQSIQDKDNHRNRAFEDPTSERYRRPDLYASPLMSPLADQSSPSGGLACAIAALAERQQVVGEPSTNYNSDAFVAHERLVSNTTEQDYVFYPLPELPAPGNTARRDDGDWSVDPGSEVAEAGTSYCSSDVADESRGFSSSMPQQDEVMGHFPIFPGPVIVPETYEEQMMLAMAVSLADARAMTSSQGVAWH
ncbi:unnamed protein product [Rhodiola kirilowii]